MRKVPSYRAVMFFISAGIALTLVASVAAGIWAWSHPETALRVMATAYVATMPIYAFVFVFKLVSGE